MIGDDKYNLRKNKDKKLLTLKTNIQHEGLNHFMKKMNNSSPYLSI
jgi:hypothetical protein